MRRLIFISAVLFSTLVVMVLLTFFAAHTFLTKEVRHRNADDPRINIMAAITGKPVSVQRENITFIMGMDHNSDNPYYREAEKYYKTNPKNRTEYIITSCRSLVDVRNYLADNAPSNGLPWGRINLVSHGNRWQGLGVPVTSGPGRSTPEGIKQAVNKGLLTEIDDRFLDDKSEIFIHGCGIGNNTDLLKILAGAFGGSGEQPRIIASRLFEIYSSDNDGVSNRFFARSWFAYYKTGYRPGDIRLARQLRKRYPQDSINWRGALDRTAPGWIGEVYHITFNIPVKWIVVYPNRDSVPDISTAEKKKNWINGQKELIRAIAEIGIPPGMFNWRFRNIRLQAKNGTFVPAIRAKGYCTVICVLKPLVSDTNKWKVNGLPFELDENDTSFFAVY